MVTCNSGSGRRIDGTLPPPGNFNVMVNPEADAYPLTGRFLLGRLRHAMTAEEKDVIESLIETTERHPSGTTLLERGECTDRALMVIEGFILRAIVEKGQRHVVSINVPGDFADLHAFGLKRLDHSVLTAGEVLIGVA